jgi:two-component system, LytTR family, sensor kinase
MLYVIKSDERKNNFSYPKGQVHPMSRVVEKKHKLDRNRLYWISQLSGWTFYGLINAFTTILYDVLDWKKILVILVLCIIGIAFTHAYREIIKNRNWIDYNLKKLIPRILIASVIIGISIFGIIYFINLSIGAFDIIKSKQGNILVGTINLSSVIFLWSLIYFAFHYFENYKKAEIESLIWENAVKEFELRTLRSQLNPHFMFNALNSIRALIQEDPANAQTAVTKLSNILRYSLKIERTETVHLEEEMQTVADYLALEKIRFEERLKYNIKVDPKSERIEIPPMMIQTLVENGIKHGISGRTNGGSIAIQSQVIDSRLHITIRNTGQINSEALKTSTGFGINNTKHRLSLLYGEKASFSISNMENEEVLTELIIPINSNTKN